MQRVSILLLIVIVSVMMLFWMTFKESIVSPIVSINSKLSPIFVDSTLVTVEVADTVEKRRTGLSGREALAVNQGMLFILDRPDFYGIWMKDMKFPLDVIWFDENLKIVDIERNIQPNSYPQVFRPDQKATYILEVNAGFTEIYNIDVGDEIHL
jgi:uncharacterized protein